MRLSRQHRRKARLLWQTVSVNGVPDTKLIEAAVRTVQQRGGRDAEAVLRCFVQRLKVYIRSNRINVVSASELPAQQQAQISGIFKGTEAERAGIHFRADPAVIGGLSVAKGYQVTDFTIARQLEVLQGKLLKS